MIRATSVTEYRENEEDSHKIKVDKSAFFVLQIAKLDDFCLGHHPVGEIAGVIVSVRSNL